MRSTTLTTSTAFLALLEFVKATYFTSPQTSTVWQAAPGQVITWHYQAGGAAVGDIVLQAVGYGGTGATVTVASQVDLTSESLTFPANVALRSTTGQYELMIVNSQDPSFAYTTVGPFSIESFSGSASAAATSAPVASSSADATSATTEGGNDSAGAPHTETNPPVSTRASSTQPPLETVTRSNSPVASPSASSSSSSSTTTTTSSARPSPSSSAPSSATAEEEPSSASSSTTAAPLSTSTVLSTASVVAITSTLSDPTSGVRTATIISASRPSSTTSGAAGAVAVPSGWAVRGAVLAATVGMGLHLLV